MSATRVPVTSIETFTGRYVDFHDPTTDQIELADLARGLANSCRFAGQVTTYYSVAEHAVYVSELVIEAGYPEYALAALHHDSHEAFLGDWPTPLKRVFGEDQFKELTLDLDCAIASRFGIDVGAFYSEPVKAADALALRREAATLKYSHGIGEHWSNDEYYAPLAGIGWTPGKAERRFLQAHHELTED